MRVLASVQEIVMAMGKLMPTTSPQIMKLFPSAMNMSGCERAKRQLSSPHSRVPTNQSGRASKLLIISSMTGQIR